MIKDFLADHAGEWLIIKLATLYFFIISALFSVEALTIFGFIFLLPSMWIYAFFNFKDVIKNWNVDDDEVQEVKSSKKYKYMAYCLTISFVYNLIGLFIYDVNVWTNLNFNMPILTYPAALGFVLCIISGLLSWFRSARSSYKYFRSLGLSAKQVIFLIIAIISLAFLWKVITD